MTAAAIRAGRSGAFGRQRAANPRALLLATGCFTAWLFAELAMLTLRHGAMDIAPTHNWTFLRTDRYYFELLPAIALLWTVVFQATLTSPPRRLSVAILMALFLCCGTHTAINRAGGASRLPELFGGQTYDLDLDEVGTAIDSLVNDTKPGRTVAVLDRGFNRYPSWKAGSYVTSWPAEDELRNSGASGPVRIIGVLRADKVPTEPEQHAIERFDLKPVSQGMRAGKLYSILVADIGPFGNDTLAPQVAR
jgi:hypothetical protein